jgi:hypothetical protein
VSGSVGLNRLALMSLPAVRTVFLRFLQPVRKRAKRAAAPHARKAQSKSVSKVLEPV